jgi:hypothetical protein
MTNTHTDYQVLAPDSVAWHIQAALVADRTGNVAARDLALDKAKSIAAERQLIEPDPGYDCRTTGERLAALERDLTKERTLRQAFDDTQREWNLRTARIEQRLDELVERLAALETCVANLNLSNLSSRVAYNDVPAGHEHDGGSWITCPFCVDDPLGMCSACNGTRRIWEMPREDE